MVNTGGLVCNGCGAYCSHAPGIGYYCTNPKCTYDRDQAKAMLDKMHRVADNAGALQARITALEASLAEAEGWVIAEVVAWLRSEAEWYDETDDGWSGFDRIAQGHREAATALETGEWQKDSPPPPTVVD